MAAATAAAAARPRKLAGYEFYHKVLGSPKYVVAPMVDQSELTWRELSRRYGADLCYTPMINSGVFIRSEAYRKDVFTTAGTDRPLVAQLCGNDPAIVLEAAKLLQDDVDAVDLNFGCPQNIAKRGRYGAFLQDEWDVVSSLVSTLHSELDVPVTCKIRIFPDLDKTLKYALMIQKSGCQILTVHGRTIKQKGQLTGMADWDYIKAIKEVLDIPVFANGNILYKEDCDECIRQTGVDGVMSAEGNLTNPTLFSGKTLRLVDVTDEYLELAKKHNSTWGQVKAHLFRMWHACLPHYTDLRDELGSKCRSIDDACELASELKRRLEAEETAAGLASSDSVEPRIHHALSGKRPCPPRWICQPRVRDIEKDTRVVADDKASRMKMKAEAAAAVKREQQENTTTCPPCDTEMNQKSDLVRTASSALSDDGKIKGPSQQKAKVRRVEALKSGKGPWQFCVKCNANPRGSRCLHQHCKSCCKLEFEATKRECKAHKLYAGPPKYLVAKTGTITA